MQKLRIILQSKYFLIISLVVTLLYILLFTKFITYETTYHKNTNNLYGIIKSFVIDGNKLSMLIKGKEKIQVTYYINSLDEKEYLEDNLLIGKKVYLEGKINVPYNNTIPNVFNYKEYLYNNRIYITFLAKKIELSGNINFFYKIKNAIIAKIDNIDNTKEYLYAFILGETNYINNDVYDTYQINGTTHLFAVSGMHISILTAVLTKIFRKLYLKEKLINVVIILFLILYMFLVGFTPSVVRGCLMFIFLLINRKLNLCLPTLIVLYILFLLLIFINPFNIYNLGFQYSFIISFGLILFKEKIIGSYLKKLIIISSIAFLFSLPITIYNFYEINLMTIFNNIIIVPFVSLLLFPLTLITFVLPFFEPILEFGIFFLENISKFLNFLELNLIVPKVNFLFFLFYYLGVYFVYKGYYKTFIYLICLILIVKFLPYLNSDVRVYFLDVGQGDSTLIVGNNINYAILIDTGGKINYDQEDWKMKNNIYDNSLNIINFLKSIGISKLDILIGTHGDIDHIGEAKNLVNNFKVEKVIFNNDSFNNLESELIKILNKKNIKFYNDLEELSIKNNKLYFLNTDIYNNENDNSIVIYFKINNFKFLFMGDVGINREKDILDKYDLSDIDFVKIGHHGSITSSSEYFINKIKPQNCFISVGKNNKYGHPNKEVLNILNNYCNIYRTDLNGSIEIQIKNKNYFIKTYLP